MSVNDTFSSNSLFSPLVIAHDESLRQTPRHPSITQTTISSPFPGNVREAQTQTSQNSIFTEAQSELQTQVSITTTTTTVLVGELSSQVPVLASAMSQLPVTVASEDRSGAFSSQGLFGVFV